jgi:hypothetical protein
VCGGPFRVLVTRVIKGRLDLSDRLRERERVEIDLTEREIGLHLFLIDFGG